MTNRKSLLEKILYISYCVITTGVTICVLFLFLIQPEGVWDLLTSTHAVGLFGFAAGAILSCIVTVAVLYARFSKKLESKDKCIKKLADDKKMLKAHIRNMAPVKEKETIVETPPSKNKNILSEIEEAFPEKDAQIYEQPINNQEDMSADNS